MSGQVVLSTKVDYTERMIVRTAAEIAGLSVSAYIKRVLLADAKQAIKSALAGVNP